MTFLVYGNREGLSSAVVDGINKGNIEFVGVFSKVMST